MAKSSAGMFHTSPTKEHVVICGRRVIDWDVGKLGLKQTLTG